MDIFKKAVLRVMVGIPGSGKSYHCDYMKEKGYKVFSSDEYRIKVCDDVNCQTRNQEVFATLYKDLLQALKNNENCILDATNISMKDRVRVFDQIKSIRDKIVVEAYVMNVPVSVCIERDSNRERCVGKDVLYKMISRFQCPQYFEGFDKIIFNHTIPTYGDTSSAVKIRLAMDVYNQNNPHHIYTLGKHCKKLAECYDEHSILYRAGLWHDVGKLVTQSFDEQKIAHYYSHDNFGAYYLCSFPEWNQDLAFDDFLLVVMIANYHMNFHKDWRTEKYKKLFGEELYNTLVEFAENDKIASGTQCIHEDIMKMQKKEKLSLEEIINSSIWQDTYNRSSHENN